MSPTPLKKREVNIKEIPLKVRPLREGVNKTRLFRHVRYQGGGGVEPLPQKRVDFFQAKCKKKFSIKDKTFFSAKGAEREGGVRA